MVFNNEYSSYPEQIDGYATMPLRRDGIDEIRAADHNRLRDAIVKIETELGTNPKGTWDSVSTRLDNIGDSHAEIMAHLADPTDAHDADTISIVDAYENFYQHRTEQVINELAYALPHKPDHIGYDLDWVPNDGIPSFVSGSGTKFVYNIGDWSSEGVGKDTDVHRTQTRPIAGIRGIHILEVSPATPNGIGTLTYNVSNTTLQWKAPGDMSAGTAVDVSGLAAGEWATVASLDVTKALRIARTSQTLPTGSRTEDFEIFALEAVDGYFSVPNSYNPYTKHAYAHFSNNITRAATSSTGVSRNQFMISGIVFPADRGTLVLQRSLEYTATPQYEPIAILNLETVPLDTEPCARFNEELRISGQKAYIPSLDQLSTTNAYDTITLFDRVPIQRDFSFEHKNADGSEIYNDYAIDYPAYQVAKYLIPISNSYIVGTPAAPSGGTLESPTDTSSSELRKVSRYRIVHFKSGIGSDRWTEDPLSPLQESEIYSMYDNIPVNVNDMNITGYRDEPNTTVGFSRVYVDSNNTRPGITDIAIGTGKTETNTRTLSGIHYYTQADKFCVVVKSNDKLFLNTYVRNNILGFSSNMLYFPSGSDSYGNYGENVDTWELKDDGYANFSDIDSLGINLPTFNSRARYIINNTYNNNPIDGYRKPFPKINCFTNKGYLTATLRDPFGIGDGYTSYGPSSAIVHSGTSPADIFLETNCYAYGAPRKRILVNSYPSRSTPMHEYFTDEDYRDGYWNLLTKTVEDFTFPTKDGYFTYDDGMFDGYRITQWDSSIPLDAYSLQCGGKFDVPDICGLIYPQNNYNGATNGSDGYVLPFQYRWSILSPLEYLESYDGDRFPDPLRPSTLPAYDGYDGAKTYQRLFALVDSDGYTYPTNSARLRIVSSGPNPISFSDIAYYNPNRFAKIEVKIPGNWKFSSTLWMDIGKLFETGKDYINDTGSVSHGALDGEPTGAAGDFTVPFTFGRKNNASSGNMIAVRITYYGGSKRTDSRTRIITEIELLPPAY